MTGSTDGIGLQTVKLLAKSAPPLQFPDPVQRIIGVHGKDPEKIRQACAEVIEFAAEGTDNFRLVTFCYDLSDVGEVKKFSRDIRKTFSPKMYGYLDVLVNNAGIYDQEGPHKSLDGRFEKTFMVNVAAPFILTKNLIKL